MVGLQNTKRIELSENSPDFGKKHCCHPATIICFPSYSTHYFTYSWFLKDQRVGSASCFHCHGRTIAILVSSHPYHQVLIMVVSSVVPCLNSIQSETPFEGAYGNLKRLFDKAAKMYHQVKKQEMKKLSPSRQRSVWFPHTTALKWEIPRWALKQVLRWSSLLLFLQLFTFQIQGHQATSGELHVPTESTAAQEQVRTHF